MITHDHKVIFIHIPKCAGRSIAELFNQRFEHFTARYYESEYRMYWNNYRKFTIVRNPYARLVSIYTYTKAHRRHSHERISAAIYGRDKTQYPTFTEWIKRNLEAYNKINDIFPISSFRNSAEGLRGFDGILGSPFWFTSQFERLTHQTGEVAVFKLENGMLPVEEYLAGIMHRSVEIPHENKSNDEAWKLFYDDKTVRIVSQWAPVVQDCKQLTYTFE